jgi:predicted MPP superfamily phosphohydrolase
MAGTLIGIAPEQAPNASHSASEAHDPAPGEPAGLTRRHFLLGSAAAAAGLAFYSCEVARHEVSIVAHTIAIANLTEAFQNYRVVQISDIHFDEYTEPAFLARIVDRVNALDPDLLLLTGDFISYGPLPLSFAHSALYQCAGLLRALTCPSRFAVLGNHDTAIGAPIIRDALLHASIPLLVNRYVSIERGTQRLWLSGVDDPASSHPDLHLAIPAKPDGPVLLMCHAPDYADHVANHSRGHLVDLMLSGHSHGGQIRMPLLGPIVLPPWGKKYPEGLYRFDRLQLYVNRGIGTVGIPFRLNCPPEITLFTLKNS